MRVRAPAVPAPNRLQLGNDARRTETRPSREGGTVATGTTPLSVESVVRDAIRPIRMSPSVAIPAEVRRTVLSTAATAARGLTLAFARDPEAAAAIAPGGLRERRLASLSK
jgi:hypothetical protein